MKKFVYVVCTLVVLGTLGMIAYREFTKGPEGGRKIRIAYNDTSLTNASIIIAYEKGYFTERGLNPEMIRLKGGKEVRQAIAAKQADIGPGAFTNFMAPMEKGAPIRFIASTAAFADFLIMRPDSNIKEFSDLYDKTISIGAQGMDELAFRSAMKKENIDVSRMKFVDIERNVLPLALMQQKVADAVVVSQQDTEGLFKAGAINMPEWKEKGYLENKVPRSLIAINTDFLNQNEDYAERFLDAMIDSHRFMKSNPEEAAKLVVDHIGKATGEAVELSPENLVAQWKSKEINNMIWQDPAEVMNLAKVAKEIGLIEKEFSTTDVFDLRFQKKLEKVQKEIYGD